MHNAWRVAATWSHGNRGFIRSTCHVIRSESDVKLNKWQQYNEKWLRKWSKWENRYKVIIPPRDRTHDLASGLPAWAMWAVGESSVKLQYNLAHVRYTRPLNTGACVEQPITGLPQAHAYARSRTWYGMQICKPDVSESVVTATKVTFEDHIIIKCSWIKNKVLNKPRSCPYSPVAQTNFFSKPCNVC